MTSRQSGMRRQGKKKSALVVGWLWRVGALLGSCAGCWEGGFAGSWDIKRADTSHRGPQSPGCGISMQKKGAQVRKSGRILPLHENRGSIEAVAVAWGIGASTTSRSSSRHHLTIHRKEGALADLERWIVTGGARGARDNPRERKGRAPGGQIAAGCPRFLPSRDPQPRLSWQELHSSMHTTGKVREIIPACPAQGFFRLQVPRQELYFRWIQVRAVKKWKWKMHMENHNTISKCCSISNLAMPSSLLGPPSPPNPRWPQGGQRPTHFSHRIHPSLSLTQASHLLASATLMPACFRAGHLT